MGMASCQDWLTEQAPAKTDIKDFFTSTEAAEQTVNAAYVPLQWEYSNDFFPEWFIGDICSDDAIKGGENLTDEATLYDMCNFKTTSNNQSLLDYYRSQWQGIARANLAIEQVGAMETGTDENFTESMKNRLIGEAKFLRAYYYFRLVRVFGGVPRIEEPIYSSNDWKQPRATAESIYELILSDLADAEADLWIKEDYDDEDLGRATKGAAMAMLMKVNLYLGEYDTARQWGEKLIYDNEGGYYDLCPNYMDNFYVEGDNGIESVFEIQYYKEGTSDWGGDLPNGGHGASRGTFTPTMTRPRSSHICGAGNTGYGFNKPSIDLYNEFEEGDPRREYTIVTQDKVDTPEQEIHYGNRFISRKYLCENKAGGFETIDNAMRCPLNRKEIRYADVLLMYAEACIESNTDLGRAKEAINRVRVRVGLGEVEATRENLRHERRVELGMEGHRWFDLCRWGIVGETMRAYKAKYSGEIEYSDQVDEDGIGYATKTNEGNDMFDFVDGKHELFPIPWEEISLGGLEQNPGY